MITYLDNAATSFPKPESVYQTMDRFARQSVANPGRAGHRMAVEAERLINDSRHRLNQLFHGESPDRIVFTLNATDSLNMAIKGVVQPGDHVITTNLEHNSISRPLNAMERDRIITLTRVEADAGGTVDPDAIRGAWRPNTKVVAMTWASNVLGTVQPIPDIGRIVRERNGLLIVDAAQAAGVVPIDLQSAQVDLLACTGHKSLFGPTGTGCLYVGSRATPKAWREGGTGGDSSSPTQPVEFPFVLEGGTPNVLGIAGLAAGVDWVVERGVDSIREHEVGLIRQLAERLDEFAGIRIVGHRDWGRKVGALSFECESLPALELGGILDQSFDIAVRPGLHCAPYIHKSVGSFPDGLVRVSPGPFNTVEDIDRTVAALKEITTT